MPEKIEEITEEELKRIRNSIDILLDTCGDIARESTKKAGLEGISTATLDSLVFTAIAELVDRHFERLDEAKSTIKWIETIEE